MGEAAELLRALIDVIRLVPENGKLKIELRGDLAATLVLSANGNRPRSERAGPMQVTLVAGALNHWELTALPIGDDEGSKRAPICRQSAEE